jgi:modulator of FtsH protease
MDLELSQPFSPPASRPPDGPRDGGGVGSDHTINAATLLGKVMSLVAVSIGVLALGSFLGRDIERGTALACSLAGVGMLFVQAFGGSRFRVDFFATTWLFGVALLLGLGLGPVLGYYASADPSVITQSAGVTALAVAATGATGFLVGRDLVGWFRPLTFVVVGLVLLSLTIALFGNGESPLLSLVIAGVSAALILVDFNYLRRHGTADDVVVLATGIFISMGNIFISLLNLFGRD